MKFIIFCVLIFITRDNRIEGAEELSEDDLKLIADRLYPAECSRLLRYFSASRTRLAKRITENSRAQCLDFLYEYNRRGKTVGFTKKSLESALRKLGRADLVSRLKKRSKGRKISKKTTRRKATRRKKKKPRTARGDEQSGKNRKHYWRKKAVTTHGRYPTTKVGRESKTTEETFQRRLITYVVAGSILILVFLGCVVIVSFRRACRCYKSYLHCDKDARDEKSCRVDKFVGQPFDVGKWNKTRKSVTETRKNSKTKEEYETLVSESETEKKNDLVESQNSPDPPNFRMKNVSFDSAETEEECNCSPDSAPSERIMSPCARIKRFFVAPKRRSRDENNFLEQKRARKVAERKIAKKSKECNDNAARKSKNRRKKTRKCIKGKRTNRERRKTIRSNRRDTEVSKPIGCTCEMCKLFDVTDLKKNPTGEQENFETNNEKS